MATRTAKAFMFIIVLLIIYLGCISFTSDASLTYIQQETPKGASGGDAEAATQEERERDRFLIDFKMDTAQNDAAQLWTCGSSHLAGGHRLPLPPEMRPFFNFTTSMRTNLKILVMGDSVGTQLSQHLQKVVLEGSSNNDSNNDNAAVLKMAPNAGRRDQAIHVAAPLVPDGNNNSKSALAMAGSGAIAGWRVTGMFLPDDLGSAPANCDRAWSLEDVNALRDFVSNATSSSPTMKTSKKNITLGLDRKIVLSASASGDFDVFVCRMLSPAWSKLEEVTEETLRSIIELANQLFGVWVVVFTSMHYCNNILTQKDREEMDRRNRLVVQFSRNWTKTHGNNKNRKGGGAGVHTVCVLDQGRLSDELMEWNARLLGFDTTTDNYT